MKKQGIIIKNLSKSYDGKSVLENFSAEIRENTAIMGASGEGKTTLCRIILGLEGSDEGEVIFEQKPCFSAVFQEDRLFEAYSAVSNVALAFDKGIGKAEARCKASELLSGLGIEENEQKKAVGAYSGGMKRRVALARSLAKKADILLLDEAFSGLDEKTKEKCASFVREKAKDTLILLITHDKAEAELLGIENVINL